MGLGELSCGGEENYVWRHPNNKGGSTHAGGWGGVRSPGIKKERVAGCRVRSIGNLSTGWSEVVSGGGGQWAAEAEGRDGGLRPNI